MSPDYKEYRSNGSDNILQFIEDYIFAEDVLEYVSHLPGGQRWYLHSCRRIDVGVYESTFCTNEYLCPWAPEARLHILAAAPDTPTGEWKISVHK